MKRFFHKYVYCCILTAVLLAVLLVMSRQEAARDPFYFYVDNDTSSFQIRPFQSEDGSFYVFLPSHADLNQIRAEVSDFDRVTLNGIRLKSGMILDTCQLKTEYSIQVNGSAPQPIYFLQSANTAAMYIEISSAALQRVHEDLGMEETAVVTLVPEAGTAMLSEIACTIRGRGNITWNYDKKPYLLKFSNDTDLLGMGAASKWVLLANATENSNLHNKIVHDMALAMGMEGTPECRYVDLYLNGQYNGLYLLAEKVEPGSNRLNIDLSAGDFLCRVDLQDRWDKLNLPFLTDVGRVVEIAAYNNLIPDSEPRIHTLVNRMEEEILSSSTLPSLDLRSWVCRYLIDEISGNIDADLASSYFYFHDGIFYAGPVWDYDRSFGNSHRNHSPQTFTANIRDKTNFGTSWYYPALYANATFYTAMTEIYQQEFLPYVQWLIDTGISQMAQTIEASSNMNSIRWASMFRDMYEDPELYPSTPDTIIQYLRDRTEFLNSAWIEDTPYCTVQFESDPEAGYRKISVVRGHTVGISHPILENGDWVVSTTGAAFDPEQPIVEDILLVQRENWEEASGDSAKQQDPQVNPLATSHLLVLLCTVSVVLLLIVMAIIDHKWDHNAEKHRTHIQI